MDKIQFLESKVDEVDRGLLSLWLPKKSVVRVHCFPPLYGRVTQAAPGNRLEIGLTRLIPGLGGGTSPYRHFCLKQIRNADIITTVFIKYQITPNEKLVESVREMLTHAKWFKCDELDCNISFARKETNKTPEEILSLVPEASSTHFAARDASPSDPQLEYCLNISHNSKSYFIWWMYNATRH